VTEFTNKSKDELIEVIKILEKKNIELESIKQQYTDGQAQIQKINESLRLSLKSSKAGTWDWNIGNNEFYWSKEFYEIFGLEDSVKPGFEAWTNALYPDDREVAAQKIKNAIDENKELISDYRIVLPDKTIRWIRATGKTLYDEQNIPLRMIGLCMDITESKHTEEAFKQQYAFDKALINTAQIIILVFDTEGKIISVNPFFENLTGYHSEELKGKDWFDTFLPKEDHSKIREIFKNAIGDIKTNGNVNSILSKDGREILIEWYDSTLRDFEGRLIGLLSIGIDITLRKQAEKSLRDSELKHRILFESAGDAIFIHNDSKMLAVNPMACERLGYTYTELMNMILGAVDSPEQSRYLPERITKLMEKGNLAFETVHQCKDGSLLPTEVRARLITWDGQPAIMSICRDITERIQLQQQLIQSEKLSAVGQLAAGIAHEFNNILAISQVNTQLLELTEKNNISLESLELLKNINNAIKRGAAVVSNMMDFAKPKEPKKELSKIENIIEDVLNLQKQQLILDNIEIDRNYEHSEKINIDSGQFQQVFLNMIINARHAILPKGKGKIAISVKNFDKKMVIKISDNGIGIDNENLKNIFTPFFTTKGAHAQNNYGIKGTGLGLAVSYTIIKNHNGTISIESEKDKGATFIIEIPITESKIEILKKEPEKRSDEFDKKVLNILIIDDEPTLLSIMTKLFTINNCIVKDSVSGLEGINLAKKNKFDGIFLDMLLPDISGENILKEIRKFNTEVPIVFISGQIGLEVERLKNLGAYSFIQKPFDMEIVKKILNEIRKN